MGHLDGSVALVTGAARGQGRAHALALAREGADVLLVDICHDLDGIPYPLATPDDLARTADEVKAIGVRCETAHADVRSRKAIDAAVAQGIESFGGIDILVANAGVWAMTPIREISSDLWDLILGVNVTGTWNTVRACLDHFAGRKRGAIVITGSCQSIEAADFNTHYTTAKHALIGLMRSVALEMGPHNVRCNAVIPGAIDTQMNNWQGALDTFAGRPGGTQEDRQRAGENFALLPGAGMLPPEVMADAVTFLVSPAARWITGAILPIDAGHLLKPAYG